MPSRERGAGRCGCQTDLIRHEVQAADARAAGRSLQFVCERLFEVGPQQMLEGGSEIGPNDLIVIEVDVREHALVEIPTSLTGGRKVLAMRLAEECQHSIELTLKVVVVGLSLRKLSFSASFRERNPLLLRFERFDVDCIGVVSLEHLRALDPQRGQLALGFLPRLGQFVEY